MSLSRSYSRGILVVLYTVLASALLSVIPARTGPGHPRAAQDLGGQSMELGRFRFLERSGQTVTQDDLADRVWIGSFIFTRCPLSCPRISSVVKSLQEKLAGTSVLLVSLSVDPEHDTPPVLAEYASRFGADPARWWFLTGDRDSVYELIQSKFKLTVMENPSPDPAGSTESILHSDRLALVDRGRVVGLFDSKEPAALEALVAQARKRATPSWVRALPSVNACLNALCATLLVTGWCLIRRRPAEFAISEVSAESTPDRPSPILRSPPVRLHVLCMALAVLTSGLFLASYLVYHYHAGSVAFRGEGPLRWLYFTILLSHTLLATFGVVPLVALTLVRALRRDFSRHARIAALTFPIWLYVSVTGVAIYLMLYHLPVTPASALSPT
jgi:protein SCO1/2/putative membrane protein